MSRKKLIIPLLVLSLGMGASTSLLADDSNEEQPKQTVQLPKQWVGKGYKLRLPEVEIELEAETVEIDDEYARVEVIDRDGRIVSRDTIYPGWKYQPRSVLWRVGASVGATSPLRGSAWNKAQIPVQVEEYSVFTGRVLDEKTLIFAQIDRRTARTSPLPSLVYHYDATTFWLGAGYLMAPWGLESNGWFRKLHVDLFGAIGYGASEMELVDSYQKVAERHTYPAIAAGSKLEFPLLNNFWLNANYYLRVETVRNTWWDVKGPVLLNTFGLGGHYAF